jgi:signal transduction histidine kinase
MPDGGRLSIKTKKLQDGLFMAAEFIDTGTGIKPEDAPKIFDPFFTTKGPGKGVGLGLFISEGIIKNHGGTISLGKNEGGGTIVTIQLPVRK